MPDFTVLRSDIRRACAPARVFAVNRRIAPLCDSVTEKLKRIGVGTVFFDGADEFEPEGTVVLAFGEGDIEAAEKAAFFVAPASAPLEVKMRSQYVSNLDGESAVIEMADLIIMAKKS